MFIGETIVSPSNDENTFFTLEILSFFATAAIEGPFPDTDAPSAPLSTRSVMIYGSEPNIADVARPLSIIAFQ